MIPDEISVQVTLDHDDLEELRKNFEIDNKEDACNVIRECISFYVESHKESVSSLSGFVTTLCEFRDKDRCSEYCDGWDTSRECYVSYNK